MGNIKFTTRALSLASCLSPLEIFKPHRLRKGGKTGETRDEVVNILLDSGECIIK